MLSIGQRNVKFIARKIIIGISCKFLTHAPNDSGLFFEINIVDYIS